MAVFLLSELSTVPPFCVTTFVATPPSPGAFCRGTINFVVPWLCLLSACVPLPRSSVTQWWYVILVEVRYSFVPPDLSPQCAFEFGFITLPLQMRPVCPRAPFLTDGLAGVTAVETIKGLTNSNMGSVRFTLVANRSDAFTA